MKNTEALKLLQSYTHIEAYAQGRADQFNIDLTATGKAIAPSGKIKTTPIQPPQSPFISIKLDDNFQFAIGTRQ